MSRWLALETGSRPASRTSSRSTCISRRSAGVPSSRGDRRIPPTPRMRRLSARPSGGSENILTIRGSFPAKSPPTNLLALGSPQNPMCKLSPLHAGLQSARDRGGRERGTPRALLCALLLQCWLRSPALCVPSAEHFCAGGARYIGRKAGERGRSDSGVRLPWACAVEIMFTKLVQDHGNAPSWSQVRLLATALLPRGRGASSPVPSQLRGRVRRRPLLPVPYPDSRLTAAIRRLPCAFCVSGCRGVCSPWAGGPAGAGQPREGHGASPCPGKCGCVDANFVEMGSCIVLPCEQAMGLSAPLFCSWWVPARWLMCMECSPAARRTATSARTGTSRLRAPGTRRCARSKRVLNRPM